MPKLFWSAPAGASGNSVTLLNAQGQLPVGAAALAVDATDIVYPAPGGGLLRVPVGGGPATQLVGSLNGQLVFWDASAGQWVVSPTAPADGQSPIWDSTNNRWNQVPAVVAAGTVSGAILGQPGSPLNSGFLSRRGFVNAASSRLGTTFAGCTLEAATTLLTAADLGKGNWFIVDAAASGGGGAGGNLTGADGQGGPAGGGGARRRAIYTRAEMIAMLPIVISAALAGTAGIGRTSVNNVTTIPNTPGGNGGTAAFGRFFAGGGSGGSSNLTGRHAGGGGGLFDAPTPGTTTAAQLGGVPAATAGAAGLFLEGAGHGSTAVAGPYPGVPAIYGGASGGSSGQTDTVSAGDGGCSSFGGGGGGSGRSSSSTLTAGLAGGDGGSRRTLANQTSGGGAAGGPGTAADNLAPAPGAAGADGDAEVSGSGGGGGGNNGGNVTTFRAGAGGAGGFPGGGGGGGGSTRISQFSARTCVGGDGAAGGDALVLITGLA